MYRLKLFLIVSILALVAAGAIFWVSADDDDEKVALSDVPAKVIQAANNVVPGGEITGVEKDEEDGQVVYEVEKVVDGVKSEIEVSADGMVGLWTKADAASSFDNLTVKEPETD